MLSDKTNIKVVLASSSSSTSGTSISCKSSIVYVAPLLLPSSSSSLHISQVSFKLPSVRSNFARSIIIRKSSKERFFVITNLMCFSDMLLFVGDADEESATRMDHPDLPNRFSKTPTWISPSLSYSIERPVSGSTIVEDFCCCCCCCLFVASFAPPPPDEDFDFFALNKKEERQPLRFDDDEVDGLENKRSLRRRANASSFSSSFEWTQEEEEKQRAAADW